MMMLTQVIVFTVFASLPQQVHMSVFLGKHPDEPSSGHANPEFEHALLSELESVLGSGHRTFTEKRLSKIEDVVRPIFNALPKNEHGKLGHAAVSYVTHRLFVHRHGWFIIGLEPGSKGNTAWNETSPLTLFEDKVPKYVQSVFEKRLGDLGMGVHEVAVLAATLEHLVHQEAIKRLQLSYAATNFSSEDVVSNVGESQDILDTYMSLYILGALMANKTEFPIESVRKLRDNVAKAYPTWPDTQAFIREVQDSMAPNRDYLYFSDVASVIEEVGERYGRWQHLECRQLTDILLSVEDTGHGGAGRVRLSDFYKLALNEGKWQFSESVLYMRRLGALDESDPNNPRVIIANYINSPSNCIASSSYYSVCCINECESLLAHLEKKLAKPNPIPSEIAEIVASLLSPTQQSSRQLSSWLLHQLDAIAAHHGGKVPLHGRLFSQWMHFAYPRECPYPHVAGTTEPGEFGDLFQSVEAMSEFTASDDQMQFFVDSAPARVEQILNASAHEELTMLSMEEELVVWLPPQPASALTRPMPWLLRGCAFVAAIVAMSTGLVKSLDKHLSSQPFNVNAAQKYYV